MGVPTHLYLANMGRNLATLDGRRLYVVSYPLTLSKGFPSVTKITILGHEFELADRYAEGTALNANEAAALNSLRAENIRNNFTKTVKKAQESDDSDIGSRLQDEFQTYESNYDFTIRVSKPVIDAVTREAQKLAKGQITAALQQRGNKPSDLKPGAMEAYVETLLARKPEILEEARRRIDALKNVSEDILSDVAA